jgi:ParB family chromosome partitioning protein
MAARRGLNKGRGLGSLIPQKIKTENSGNKESSIREESAEKSAGSKKTAGASEKTEVKSVKKDMSKTSDKNKVSAAEKKTGTATNESTLKLRISQIVPNQEQPRKDFSEETIKELADSIRQYGILQPLLVQKNDNYYEIIAGERRWRAAKLAGLKEIPVIIRELSKQEQMEIALIENIQREDLNPIDEAKAYKKLLVEFNLTQDELAERVSKSRTAITNTMRH